MKNKQHLLTRSTPIFIVLGFAISNISIHLIKDMPSQILSLHSTFTYLDKSITITNNSVGLPQNQFKYNIKKQS